MNVKYMYSLLAVIVLFLVSYVLAGTGTAFKVLFGIILPYAALLTFIIGFISRIMNWGRSAVPFRITTTSGQQKSLPWIKPNAIDNPFSKGAVVVRMFLEIVDRKSVV